MPAAVGRRSSSRFDLVRTYLPSCCFHLCHASRACQHGRLSWWLQQLAVVISTAIQTIPRGDRSFQAPLARRGWPALATHHASRTRKGLVTLKAHGPPAEYGGVAHCRHRLAPPAQHRVKTRARIMSSLDWNCLAGSGSGEITSATHWHLCLSLTAVVVLATGASWPATDTPRANPVVQRRGPNPPQIRTRRIQISPAVGSYSFSFDQRTIMPY